MTQSIVSMLKAFEVCRKLICTIQHDLPEAAFLSLWCIQMQQEYIPHRLNMHNTATCPYMVDKPTVYTHTNCDLFADSVNGEPIDS